MHVFYSKSEDNPYLPPGYIDSLREGMSKLEADVKLRGLWRDIAGKGIYHSYDAKKNYLKSETYKIDPRAPVWISWDFNIGEGKPMSAIAFQLIGKTIHFFDEVVVEGMRTQDSCDEWYDKPWFGPDYKYYITGDSNGRHKSTKSTRTDYEIIKAFFSNYKRGGRGLDFEMRALRSNPRIRDRHNQINALCCNDFGKVNLYIYKEAPTADKALRLTKLKKGANIIEDDSDAWQHIGTAMGYGAWRSIRMGANKRASGTYTQ